MEISQKVGAETANQTCNNFDKLFPAIKDLFSYPTYSADTLSFQDVIKYFKTETPKVFSIKKAAIYKEKHPDSYMIAFLFLDNQNNIAIDPKGDAYGCVYVVKTLDKKLESLLADTNFIILK